MVRFISFFLVTLGVAAGQTNGAAVRSGRQPGLKFIGELSKPMSILDSTVEGQSAMKHTSYYFLSHSTASHHIAEIDCKSFIGEDAHLLHIETQEELEHITEILGGCDGMNLMNSIFWTSGRYDPQRQTFVWGNGIEIGPWAPWDVGMPNCSIPASRVYARFDGSLWLGNTHSFHAHRYICELTDFVPEEEAIPCYKDNDLAIVVDSSVSIGQRNYMIALEFTSRLATTWADNPNNRLSVIIFSNNAQSIINLHENLTVSQIRDKVYSAPYLNGGTASDIGLDRALQEFNSNPKSVPKNLVFLTGGVSNNPELTIAAANRVQSAGIKAFSVGIGSSLNPIELLAIAGGRQDHVFNTDGFADLLKLLQPISRKVCE